MLVSNILLGEVNRKSISGGMIYETMSFSVQCLDSTQSGCGCVISAIKVSIIIIQALMIIDEYHSQACICVPEGDIHLVNGTT